MTTEIRDFGDGKTVVVYTNDRATATKLGNYKSCFKIIPYEQVQYSNKKVALVGVDYYFPKRQLKSLCRKVGIPFQPLPRNGEFHIGSFT